MGGFEQPDRDAAAQCVLSNAKLLRKMGFEVPFMVISKDIQKAPAEVEGFNSVPVPYPTNIRE